MPINYQGAFQTYFFISFLFSSSNSFNLLEKKLYNSTYIELYLLKETIIYHYTGITGVFIIIKDLQANKYTFFHKNEEVIFLSFGNCVKSDLYVFIGKFLGKRCAESNALIILKYRIKKKFLLTSSNDLKITVIVIVHSKGNH